MSFSREIKLELLNKQIDSCCKEALYCSFLRLSKNISRDDEGVEFVISFEFKEIMLDFIQWLKLKFDFSPKTINYTNSTCCAVTYQLKNGRKLDRLMDFARISPMLGQIVFEEYLSGLKECCVKSYIAGAFLICGSIADPNTQYHLEIRHKDAMMIEEVDDALGSIGILGNVVERKDKFIFYIKDSESISDFLKYLNLNQAMFKYEDIRILKETRNKVNREVNCETANMQKTIDAAVRQIKCIEYLQECGEYKFLSKGLREAADVRMDNPEASIEELSMMMSKTISKSGMNHRLRKLVDIAENKGFTIIK